MSFDAVETSIRDATTLRLYDFNRLFKHWRYTSADRDVVIGGQAYKAVAISDDGKTESGEAAQETFTVTAPLDIDVAAQFAVVPPSQKVVLTVLDMHDGDSAAEVFWTGQITKVSRPAGKVQIACESIVSAMRTSGLSISWQRTCPYTTYDVNCGANKAAQRVDGTLTVVGANTVAAAAFAGAPLNLTGGSLEWQTTEGLPEARMIIGHVDDTLTLMPSSFGLVVGMAVAAYPVCDYTPQGCALVNDPANYGGVPGLPGKSPFVNSPFA